MPSSQRYSSLMSGVGLPMLGGVPMTDGDVEAQTRACLDSLGEILAEAGCDYSDVVKSMVWLKQMPFMTS